MPDQPLILRADPLELELSPSTGGAIARFEALLGDGRAAILRRSHSPPENVLEAASFPLVPYVNRIRDGRFTFQGREVQLSPNMPGDPSPLHGQGWRNAWTVEQAGESDAVLTYRHDPGEWPWAYQATQHVSIDPLGLSLTLTCRNRADGPMPCGLGFHPYFPCGPETRIRTAVTHAWTIDEKVLPVEKVPATGRFDLSDRNVCGQDLDNGFGGWSGRALLDDPDWPFELELSSPEARFFQLYSPEDGGIFVAEPVSHANAALNEPEAQWAKLGIQILAPGEEMALSMRLEVRGSS